MKTRLTTKQWQYLFLGFVFALALVLYPEPLGRASTVVGGGSIPPPVITLQPADQTVTVGGTATFNVLADGIPPLSYQWFFGNNALAGRTSTALVLTSVMPDQAGYYSAVASNLYGTATSTPARLTVTGSAPRFVLQPQGTNVYEGMAITLRGQATGTLPLFYQWQKDGQPLQGATASVYSLYTIPRATTNDSGVYRVVVTNLLGSATSSNAPVVVRPLPPCMPPPEGLVSWWRAESNSLDGWGANDAYAGPYPYQPTYVYGKVGRALSLMGSPQALRVPDSPSLRFTNALSIESWVMPAANPIFSARTIIGKWNPGVQPGYVTPGTNVSFWLGLTNGNQLCLMLSPTGDLTNVMRLLAPGVLATSVWTFVVATYDGASVQLYANAVLVARTNYSGGIFPGTGDAGIGGIPDRPDIAYSFWSWMGALDEISLYNRALSDAEIQGVYAADAAGKCLEAPVITLQPQNQAVPLGEDVKFSIGVQGTRPLRYQWRFNGRNLLNATNGWLVLEKVQTSSLGDYSVLVSNALGSVTSSNATLTLLPAPVCVSPPTNLVSWWAFDNSPIDVAGTNNGARLSGNFGVGKVGQALGPDMYGKVKVQVPSSDSLNFGSNADFSIEGWIKALPPVPGKFLVADPVIIQKKSLTTSSTVPSEVGYSLFLDRGRLACWLGSGPLYPRVTTNTSTFISSGPDLRDGMFHHVALSLDRSAPNGGALYVDGQPVLTFDPTARIDTLANTNLFLIGAPIEYGAYTNLNGWIDEMAIYDRALSPAEVAAIKQAGAAGKCKVQPFIITQPTNLTLNPGGTAVFIVAAGGTPEPRYQWLLNGYRLAGATSSTLVITNVAAAPGTYVAWATNGFGTAVSQGALLKINRPPLARCANRIVSAGTNCLASAVVNAGSSDPDGDRISLVQFPPGPYPLGTNIVQLTVSDDKGLSNSCSALVIVLDKSPPNLRTVNVITTNAPNQCGAIVNFPLPIATDSCSPVTNITCAPPPGSFFPVGVTIVQCTATDAAGNVGSNRFSVTVRDTQAPSITCPADITVTNAHDAWSTNVSFEPLVSDNCPGVGLPICNPPSGSGFTPGIHTVTCSVIDRAGNSSQCTFTVSVVPGNLPPVPVITISPLANFPGVTNLLVIAPNALQATVRLDASASYDVDDSHFLFAWYAGTNLLSTNAILTQVLAVGSHEITLLLDDMFPYGTNAATTIIDVVSPAQAVGILIGMVENATVGRNPQPLLASLRAAAASFERHNWRAGMNHLEAFEKKVRTQVAPSDPVLAGKLITAAESILNALSGG